MRTIGLLGGMSWESTSMYLDILNRTVRARRGGLHSAQLLLQAFDFSEIADLQQAGRWDVLERRMSHAARGLQEAGAACILLCSNLMHRTAPAISHSVTIPLLPITTAVALRAQQLNVRRLGLLGARQTMEAEFYRHDLIRQGIETVCLPEAPERAEIHRIIFEDLCRGRFPRDSRDKVLACIESLAGNGAEAVVLGCTELPILLDGTDAAIPCLDTVALHCEYALNWAIDD